MTSETSKANSEAPGTDSAKATQDSGSTPEPRKFKERPQPPQPPKATPKDLPTAPPADYKQQWADAKAPNASQQTADTMPVPGSTPVNTPALPKIPEVSPGLPSGVLPVMPSHTVAGQPTPSLSPTKSMLGSQAGMATARDPLTSPEFFAADKGQGYKATGGTAPASGGQGSGQPRMPLGSASVVAAANGGEPLYLPVPMMMIPQPHPMVPQTQPGAPNHLPQVAPDVANSGYVNAFSTAPSSEGLPDMNAFGMGQQQPMMMPQQPMMMPPAYNMSYRGPMPPLGPGVAQQYMQMPPFMAQGYPQQMPPFMAQGYPQQMPPVMAMGYPQQWQSMPMMPQAQPMPVTYTQPGLAYANPAMDRPGLPSAGPVQAQKCINILQSALSPLDREAAVNQLCACDWRQNPQIITVLLTTAKHDPVGMVRVAAVSGLARMGMATEPVVSTMNQLRSDADPRVRHEADQALRSLGVQPAVGH
jgi:hypothetical protein